MIRNLIFTTFYILFFLSATGQEVVNVNVNPYENLGKKIGFKEDKKKELSFSQVEALPSQEFNPGKNKIFNGGPGGKVWWMKIKYTAKLSNKVYLVLDFGNIDYIDIYYRDSLNKLGHIRSGTFAGSSSRAFLSTEYIFALPDDIKGDVKNVYVRLEAVNTLLAPVKLVNGMVLANAFLNKYFWQVIYIGVAISLFLFNLLMLILTRDRLYGLYIIRILTLFYIYVLAYLNGFAHFFGDSLGRFILIHAHVFAAIGFIVTIYFNNLFLNVKKHLPGSLKFFNILYISWLIILIVSFWDTRAYTNRFAQLLLFISSISILYISIRVLQKQPGRKNPFLICYTLSWVPICLGTIYVILAVINVFPFEDYTLKILTGVGVLEATLISLALLGDRVRLLRKGKEKAEKRTISLIQERNTYLERKIEERTKELQIVNDKLQESNVYKDKLFSIIAHDMRSPLSSLKGVLQLADQNMLDPKELGDLLTRIRLNTEQVQQTMDNLLNWSISQMDMQRYHPETIELNKFLHEHLAIYETLATNKGIVTEIRCPDQINVIADKNQLSLICRNLLDNAVKFTPQNGLIKIYLLLQKESVILCIANSGKILSEAAISKLLAADGTTLGTSYGTSMEPGTGLGLYLCKEFIGNLNSELKIESGEAKDEVNTIFYFEIPLTENPAG